MCIWSCAPSLMKLLKTGTLALSLTVTATVGLAADYEIFSGLATVETGANHYAAERLDHKNKKLHHCTAVLDANPTLTRNVNATKILPILFLRLFDFMSRPPLARLAIAMPMNQGNLSQLKLQAKSILMCSRTNYIVYTKSDMR